METRVIVEEPAIVLHSRSYNGESNRVVSWNELRNASVGEAFYAEGDNCGRDCDEEYLTIVYKDGSGVLGKYEHYGTTDSPNPTEWKDTPELIWFEFLD